jgi:hypothetical protein
VAVKKTNLALTHVPSGLQLPGPAVLPEEMVHAAPTGGSQRLLMQVPAPQGSFAFPFVQSASELQDTQPSVGEHASLLAKQFVVRSAHLCDPLSQVRSANT